MTPKKEEVEQKKLAAAIRRWFRLGGSYDRIDEIAAVIYATKATSQRSG
jgi:hypothetical protein